MAYRPSRSARADLYTRITTDFIAAIETGAEEWRMPWHHDGSSIARPRNVASDKSYRDGISADDECESRPRFFARGYYAYNEAQVDGRVPPELPRLPESERIAAADAFFSALEIPIISGERGLLPSRH